MACISNDPEHGVFNYVNDIEIPQNLRPTYKGDISNIADYGTVLSKSLFC